MKLRYSNNTIILSAVLTGLWIFFGIVNLLDTNNDTYIIKKYGYGIVAILNILSLYLNYTNGYGKLENGVLTKGKIIKKKINISEIIDTQNNINKIIFITPNTKMVLNNKYIHEEDWKTFTTSSEISKLFSKVKS